MEKPEGGGSEIRQIARYEVRPAALAKCLAAIVEFIDYVQAATNAGAKGSR